jgi:hypothetical protein
MGLLLPRIEPQPAPGRRRRRRHIARAGMPERDRSCDAGGLEAHLLTRRGEPPLERCAVDEEAFEEVPAVERQRILEPRDRGRIGLRERVPAHAGSCAQERIDVDPARGRAVGSDHVAVETQERRIASSVAQHAAQVGEGVAEVAACGRLRLLRPQQVGEGRPRPGPVDADGEVGQQRPHLVGTEPRQRLALTFGEEGTEQTQRPTGHGTPLVPGEHHRGRSARTRCATAHGGTRQAARTSTSFAAIVAAGGDDRHPAEAARTGRVHASDTVDPEPGGEEPSGCPRRRGAWR